MREVALRSRTTSVPAARSPRRWLCSVTRIAAQPTRYADGMKSINRSVFRMVLARNPIGKPPTRTTRSPFRRFPGVRPDESTSNKMW